MNSYYKINLLNIKKRKINSGDKSISHRLILICFLKSIIIEALNILESNDLLITINLFKNLGLKIYGPINRYITISSFKKNNFNNNINFIGNSGTSIRISLSLFIENNIFIGDKSLNKRTMYRVIKPLTLIGYIIQCKKNHFTPLIIIKKNYFGLKYNLINISSQIKSCLILSSINSFFKIYIKEKKKTRDHSERFIFSIKKKNFFFFFVPNDFSTISFIICYYILNKKKFIVSVNINKLRIGLLEYLYKNNIKFIFLYKKIIKNEHYSKIFFFKSVLNNKVIFSKEISKMIDEIPVLLILIINVKKKFKIYGLEELKYKESNRFNLMINNLKLLGINIINKKNYLILKGGNLHKNFFLTYNDHRLFLSIYIIGNNFIISNVENILSSFPNFFKYFNNNKNFYYVNNK
ncbi:3-phosphoshikimate 1-carboxyvinyltransferase [Candidatus Carsonella ruddii]|uniref:3-phosphoshikimate 1-carboxyvinyltransferase n=1 Tax=Candidatus Carsonella ruddii CE isolate Thao2000 TaxID=1202536 RepID=J7GVW9_CARRU|nr:3-phosphoshikimate 1-carboxyvinyltransferase [Candidatus Carsonella ruddii]AFP83531.1 3-phosphoshikimate 1-carboxyvinyltransferase [Candidatus Carsonella ruddii CE isolate Thao2000]